MRLIVARHCQTEWNVRGLIQGVTDNPLDATGREQAERLAMTLDAEPIVHIYSSDLVRAIQTATPTAVRKGIAIRSDPRFREFAFGTLEGSTAVRLGLRAGLRDASPCSDPLECDLRRFGGERGQDVFNRQFEALEEMRLAHVTDTVLLVGHSRSLRTLFVPLGYERARRLKNGQCLFIDL